MDNYYWYYTLSTIPQTLAAMIALAATFVVFKLATISGKISDARKDLRRFILLATSKLDKNSFPTEIHQIEPLANNKFLELYETGLANLRPDDEYLGLEEGVFKKYEQELSRIIQDEWHSFYSAKDFRIFGYLTMKKDILKSLLSLKWKSIILLTLCLALVALTTIASLIALPRFDQFAGSVLLVDIIGFFAVLSIIITAYSVWVIAKND